MHWLKCLAQLITIKTFFFFFFKVEALQKYQIIETFCRVALAKGAGTHEVVGQQKESS